MNEPLAVREAPASYVLDTQRVRPGYKQTEVGVIPEDWEVITLLALAERKKELFDDGDWIESEHITNQGVRLIQTGNIGIGHFIEKDVKKYIYENSFISLRCNELKLGDLLVCRLADPAGRACVLGEIGEDKIVTSVDVTIFRPPSNMANRVFLANLFSTPKWFRAVGDRSGGTTHKRISRGALGLIPIPLPPLPEQAAIAGALSDADALIEGLEQLITKKRHLKQGAMQELLTGKKRLPGFGGEWEEATLLELALGKKELFDDGDWVESEHITTEGVRLIQTGNIGIGKYIETDIKKYIYESSFVSLRCKEVREGDLLICRLADPAGRACVLPNIGEAKIITSVDVTIFRPPCTIANRVFLANLFSTDKWFRAISDRSGGTTHKRIARGALGQLKIKIPQLSEQTAIATLLSDMDTEIAALEQQFAKARGIKQGMMQELLTGKIRLV